MVPRYDQTSVGKWCTLGLMGASNIIAELTECGLMLTDEQVELLRQYRQRIDTVIRQQEELHKQSGG